MPLIVCGNNQGKIPLENGPESNQVILKITSQAFLFPHWI